MQSCAINKQVDQILQDRWWVAKRSTTLWKTKNSSDKANTRRVQKLVEADPYITYAQIKAETSLHPPYIRDILQKQLNLIKLASR